MNKKKLLSGNDLYRAKGYLFLLPSLIIVFIFVLYPAVDSFFKSLHLISPMGDKSIFVGLDNYIELLTSRSYLNSLKITFIFLIMTVPVGLFISLMIAVLLNLKIKAMTFYRTSFFMPLAISPAMAGIVWLFLFNPNIGFLNYLLSLININGPAWLTDPKWALFSITLVTVWKQLGFNVIIFLAGLQNVPDQLYEAAAIDGAGQIKQFYHITLPMISPTTFYLVVVSVIKSFQVFGQIHVLTQGGPAQATNLLVYSLYQDAFVNFNFGFAASQAYIIFVIVLIITLIQFKLLGRKVHYQ